MHGPIHVVVMWIAGIWSIWGSCLGCNVYRGQWDVAGMWSYICMWSAKGCGLWGSRDGEAGICSYGLAGM